MPFLVKDLDNSYEAGQPYHGGTRYLQKHDYRPAADSELIRRYKAAGLVIIGRTNCPELGLQPTTEPADPGRHPQPVGPDPVPRRLQRGLGRGRRRRPGAHGPRR